MTMTDMPMPRTNRCALAGAMRCTVLLLILAGCATEKSTVEPIEATGPDYSRPLPPGQPALRLVTDSARMPEVGAAYQNRDVLLLEAIDQSVKWFEAPSSRKFFPFALPDGEVTHEQAVASLRAFAALLEHSSSEADFLEEFRRMFNVYESVGYNGEGVVLFTGYYTPIFKGSRTPGPQYAWPLYKRPDDLVTDPLTGEPKGRRMPGGTVVPYASRKVIEETNMFRGHELVWLKDALSAYIVQVNGSAKIYLEDGTTMYVGYAGKTDRPYYGLGQAMLDAGLLTRDELSLASIRRVFRAQPDRVRELMWKNESYVFFTEYAGDNWPAGSLGARVTAESTLATDKKIYPRGGIVLVDTRAVTFSQGHRRFLRFMLDQDTGGAIQAPGRADIFMGIGPGAEILAGGQYAEGRLYYLFLKPEYLPSYVSASGAASAPRR